MPLSGITINVNSAGIGRRSLNYDKISGILFYASSYPSGLNVNSPVGHCYSINDVVNLGITSTDATFKGLWYQCSEYFRMNPNGDLYVGVYPPGTYTFAEIKSMCDVAQGNIRQIGVYAPARAYTNLAADLVTIASISATIEAAQEHCSIIFAPNCSAVANWNSPTNVRTTAASRKISVIIAQDGGGQGASLATALGYSVPMLGNCLGCISAAKVNQSIGEPALFNISNGVECETVALSNGQLVSTVGNTTLGALKDAGYIVARKYTPMLSGSYFERVPTSTVSTDTYAWMEVVRPIDKATRLCEQALTPYLQAPLTLKSTGQLSDDTIGFFSDLLVNALNGMKAASEISDFKILIDPTQNVLSTSTLIVTVKILPTATAEFITINIGMYASL